MGILSPRIIRWSFIALLSLLLLAGCSNEPPSVVVPNPAEGDSSDEEQADAFAPTVFTAPLKIIRADGTAISPATVTVADKVYPADTAGLVSLVGLQGPVLAVVAAAGHLSEPVVIGKADAAQPRSIQLLDDHQGKRWALHVSGDVMFGRRFETPKSGTPQIPASDPATGALNVVRHIQPAFQSADLRTINLETTVSDLTLASAYPAKRFILNARPETLAAVKALGADAVLLANNHTRDYQEIGLQATIDALNAHQLRFAGASVNATDAYAPLSLTVAGLQIGLLSWTSVTGSFVNNNYPTATAAVPVGLAPEEAWQYELRSWSYTSSAWTVAAGDRRIGEVWRLYQGVESSLTTTERAAAWGSMVVVYPELQDWVARRGHGGAAMWSDSTSPPAITALKSRSDAVIVQLHSGFQYQEAPSASVKENARLAIDAGADVVICHHPHVLQGVEWYKGRLIVYSLGNFIFDQDFLASFPSAFVRIIWEGNRPLEARLVPFEIVNYRPTPVDGPAAERTLLRVWASSLMGAATARDAVDNGVKAFVSPDDAGTTAPNFRITQGQAVITATPPTQKTINLSLAAGGLQVLASGQLVDSRLGIGQGSYSPALIGRDLFGWGSFEDVLADGMVSGDAHWGTAGTRKQIITGAAAVGEGFLRLTRFNTNSSSVLVRSVARVALKTHRLYTLPVGGGLGVPLDPEPTYSVRFMARKRGQGLGELRYDIYQFDDTNPTEDPESVLLGSSQLPISIPADGAWHQVHIRLPKSAFQTGGLVGNMVNFYFVLNPPTSGSKVTLDLDEVTFIEWRQAAAMPSRFGLYHFVENPGSEPLKLSFQALQAR